MDAMHHGAQPESAAREGTRTAVARSRRPPAARDILLYRVSDELSGVLICGMAVFSPWAFGTTQPWSIRTMNGAGYWLGLLLAAKLAIRWRTDYQPGRWEGESRKRKAESGKGKTGGRRLILALAGLTGAILAFCLVSAVNARATCHREELSFVYHDRYLPWLPHSLDSARSWPAFWNYLGIACSFWAIRDWLLGKSESEERAGHRASGPGEGGAGPLLPARLRRLLWVLAINGGLLGLEGILQRLDGSGYLLFLVKPHVNPGAETQFGPYAYRANAAQYFNLVWPVCLGLWWMLNRAAGPRTKAHHVILICCAVMAACPIISTSRGGALITVGIIVLAASLLLASHLVGWICSADKGRQGRGNREEGRENIQHPTSNIEHPMGERELRMGKGEQGIGEGQERIGNIQHPTSNIEHPMAERELRMGKGEQGMGSGQQGRENIQHPTANIEHPMGERELRMGKGEQGIGEGRVWEERRGRAVTLGCLVLFFAGALVLGFALGWKTLKPRMEQLGEGFELREHMYDLARPMAADYPLFGTGPGTFESVFQLYRISTGTYWPTQLHNDWLETRITFGWVGSGLIALAFVTVGLRWFARGGIHGGRRFMILTWLALAGCLVHARYDFPFQIYSIVFLFATLCAILSVLSRRGSGKS